MYSFKLLQDCETSREQICPAIGYCTLDFGIVHHEDQTPSESGGCSLSSCQKKISGGHQQVLHVKCRILV